MGCDVDVVRTAARKVHAIDDGAEVGGNAGSKPKGHRGVGAD
ncbi:MAG: hypothetical protein Q8L22_26020 [Reyranella sp.]|nr:hypothetical protein [Reyranella sp.]